MEIRVEQFIVVFIRIGRRWRCAAEMNGVLVAGHNGIDRWVLPCSQTFETKFVSVIGECSRNIGGEEQRHDLTNHRGSVPQLPTPPTNPGGPHPCPSRERHS